MVAFIAENDDFDRQVQYRPLKEKGWGFSRGGQVQGCDFFHDGKELFAHKGKQSD